MKTYRPTRNDFERIDKTPVEDVDCSDIPEIEDFSGFKRRNPKRDSPILIVD
jgi:hypothetical protein